MMNEATEAPRMNRPEVKRGRLRRTITEHLYDEDGAPAGQTVTAEHEPDMSAAKDGNAYMSSPPDIKTPHETYDSAESKAREHYTDNMAKFGKKGKKSGPPMAGAMMAAMGRKK